MAELEDIYLKLRDLQNALDKQRVNLQYIKNMKHNILLKSDNQSRLLSSILK